MDQAWGDQRPLPSSSEIYSLPAEFTGLTSDPRLPWPRATLVPALNPTLSPALSPTLSPALSPALARLAGNIWQEKVAGIRQQMERHSQRPTAVLLSGLEETACE